MKGSDLFVELLGEQVYLTLFVLVCGAVFPEVDLGKHLVGEGARHNERGVTGGTAQVHQTTAGEHDNSMAIGEDEAVDLILDGNNVHAWVGLKSGHVDFVVEVTNVADDSVVLHLGHVGSHDDSEVASCGNIDISGGEDGGKLLDLESFHAGLKGADRIDLSDDDTGTASLHGGGTALADVTIAADDDLLTGDHDIGGTHETVGERVAATVHVIELGLGDTIVDVDGLDEKLTSKGHLLKSMNTSGGLLRDTVETSDHLSPLLGVASLELTAQDAEHLLHLGVVGGGGVGECSEFLELLLSLHTLVHKESGITTVIDKDIGAIGVGPCEHFQGAFPVLLKGLTLPGEDVGGLGGNDAGGGVVLGGVDVAGGPSDLGTECVECLNKHTSLDSHVQRARDASTGEDFVVLVFFAESHHTGHLDFGEFVFLATEFGSGHVSDFGLEAVGVDCVVRVDHSIKLE